MMKRVPIMFVSAQDSPVLNLSDEQRADGVVIAGQLLEAIEEEAEKEKAETQFVSPMEIHVTSRPY